MTSWLLFPLLLLLSNHSSHFPLIDAAEKGGGGRGEGRDDTSFLPYDSTFWMYKRGKSIEERTHWTSLSFIISFSMTSSLSVTLSLSFPSQGINRQVETRERESLSLFQSSQRAFTPYPKLIVEEEVKARSPSHSLLFLYRSTPFYLKRENTDHCSFPPKMTMCIFIH